MFSSCSKYHVLCLSSSSKSRNKLDLKHTDKWYIVFIYRLHFKYAASHWLITYCCIKYYTSLWMGFKLTTLVVIGTDCIFLWRISIRHCCNHYHVCTLYYNIQQWSTSIFEINSTGDNDDSITT
jgi:hypothetical protein